MMNWFIRVILGGKTAKRESAIFAFLLWVIGTFWLAWADVTHPDSQMRISEGMWMVTTPFVFAWMATAFGIDWISKQTHWGGRPKDNDPDTPQ